ncbi:MAG: nitrite reductase [Pelosinus sp.]|nr:nitrite reductase [Pelosinus sp.]
MSTSLTNNRVNLPITPHIPLGFTTPAQLRTIADAAEKYNGVLKIVGNSITILNINKADGEKILTELGVKPESFIAKSVRPISTCPGKPHCPRALQDSTTLGLLLDRKLFGQDVPAKIRIGISGCPNCCAEVFVKDIGLFGTAFGYTVIIGGNTGRRAQIGQIAADKVPAENILPLIEKILEYYREQGQDKERIGQFAARIGWDSFIAAVIPEAYRK